MSSVTVQRGQTLRKHRTGTLRTVKGFTTKPTASAPSDGIRRARLVSRDGSETRVRVDQIFKTYAIA